MAKDSVGATVHIPVIRGGEGHILNTTVIFSQDTATIHVVKPTGGTIEEIDGVEANLIQDRLSHGRPVHQPILVNIQPGGTVVGPSLTLGVLTADRLAYEQQRVASFSHRAKSRFTSLAVRSVRVMLLVLFVICWLVGIELKPTTGRRWRGKVFIYASGACLNGKVVQVMEGVLKAKTVLADGLEKKAALNDPVASPMRLVYIVPKSGDDPELKSALSFLIDAGIDVCEIESLRELDRILRRAMAGKPLVNLSRSEKVKLSTAEKVDLCAAVAKVAIRTLKSIRFPVRRPDGKQGEMPQLEAPKLGLPVLDPDHQLYHLYQQIQIFGTPKELASMSYHEPGCKTSSARASKFWNFPAVRASKLWNFPADRASA